MNEVLYVNLLRVIGLVAGIIGILAALDLICGARVTRFINRASTKVIDIDKSISSPGIRISIAIVFLVFSLIMLLLIRRI
jgi:hypothetical protein